MTPEQKLASLGITQLPIPIPFAEAGGPVNVYLVEEADGGLLLFDTGLGGETALAALGEGFARAGRRMEDVRRIVLSHGHIDHFGAAQTVVDRAGGDVPVLVHPADVSKVATGGARFRDMLPRFSAFLVRLGVPGELLEAMGRAVSGGFSLARRVERVGVLTPGEVLRTRRLALEVVHMPGHTPGLCVLYEPEHRLVFSADHLLEKVSPNPVIELPPDGDEPVFRPLVAYRESIGRLRDLDVDLVLPGHGPPFGGHRQVIDGLLAFYERRQAKLLDALGEGPRTAWELTLALFPKVGPAGVFLTVSEALGNLEVLEDRGLVRRDRSGEVFRFERVG